MDVVHPLAEVIAAHVRPGGGEALVGDPAEQERFGVEQLLGLELVAFLAAVEVKRPPGLFHDPVERHELGNHDPRHCPVPLVVAETARCRLPPPIRTATAEIDSVPAVLLVRDPTAGALRCGKILEDPAYVEGLGILAGRCTKKIRPTRGEDAMMRGVDDARQEVPLRGGHNPGVVRLGATVRRPLQPDADRIHRGHRPSWPTWNATRNCSGHACRPRV